LGCERAWVCHGEGGFDEIVPSGRSWVAELKDGKITTFEVNPEDAGFPRSRAEDLKGAEAVHNAEALAAVLDGLKCAFRDAAVMTAGAALLISDKARDYRAGVTLAARAVDSGAARAVLDRLVKVSNQ